MHRLAEDLFKKIEHGDEKHRAWLREQIEAWSRDVLEPALLIHPPHDPLSLEIDALYAEIRVVAQLPQSPESEARYQSLLARLRELQVVEGERLRKKLAEEGLKPGEVDEALREAREVLDRWGQK